MLVFSVVAALATVAAPAPSNGPYPFNANLYPRYEMEVSINDKRDAIDVRGEVSVPASILDRKRGDETSDAAGAISLEASFAVELGREQGVVGLGGVPIESRCDERGLRRRSAGIAAA